MLLQPRCESKLLQPTPNYSWRRGYKNCQTCVCIGCFPIAKQGSLPLEVDAKLPFDAEFKQHFLDNYWQKRPLLIRSAFGKDFVSPVDPDELAALSADETVQSRICMGAQDEAWSLMDGPFDASTFSELPKEKWQLLVNGVDRQVPAIADLLDSFDFIPRWRIDDVMISFAVTGGGIGPHSDSYDVFLLQGSGKKRWSISVDQKYHPDDPNIHIKDLDVRILKDFHAEASWVLEPGDMLYVPPHVGHQGVALNEGQTLSIGFLAPTEQDSVLAYASDAAMTMCDGARYQDPMNMRTQENPGEISRASVAQFQQTLDKLPRDHDSVSSWMGRFFTTPRGFPEALPLDSYLLLKDLLSLFKIDNDLCRNETTRMAFVLLDDNTNTFFIDGHDYRTNILPGTPELQLIHLLTGSSGITRHEVDAVLQPECASWELLLDLVNEGYLYFLSERDASLSE